MADVERQVVIPLTLDADGAEKQYAGIIKKIEKPVKLEIDTDFRNAIKELNELKKLMDAITNQSKEKGDMKFLNVDGIDNIREQLDKLNETLKEVSTKISFEDIQPPKIIEAEIDNTQKKLENLKENAVQLNKDLKYLTGANGAKFAKLAEDYIREDEFPNLDKYIERVKEFISLGGDLSSIKIKYQVFDDATQKNEKFEIGLLRALKTYQKLNGVNLGINLEDIQGQVDNVDTLTAKLEELEYQLKKSKAKQEREFTVGLSDDSITAITEAMQKLDLVLKNAEDSQFGLKTDDLEKITAAFEGVTTQIESIQEILRQTFGQENLGIQEAFDEQEYHINITPNDDIGENIQSTIDKNGPYKLHVEPLFDFDKKSPDNGSMLENYKELAEFIVNNTKGPIDFVNKLKRGVYDSNQELMDLLQKIGMLKDGMVDITMSSGGGRNEGGIVGDDFVLLARNIAEHPGFEKKADDLIPKLHQAAEMGVQLGEIIAKVKDDSNSMMFELQTTMSGSPISPNNFEFLEATDEQIIKLIADTEKLRQVGLYVDILAASSQNIMYDKKKGFSFIDLASPKDLNNVPYYNSNNIFEIMSTMFDNINPPEDEGIKFADRLNNLHSLYHSGNVEDTLTQKLLSQRKGKNIGDTKETNNIFDDKTITVNVNVVPEIGEIIKELDQIPEQKNVKISVDYTDDAPYLTWENGEVIVGFRGQDHHIDNFANPGRRPLNEYGGALYYSTNPHTADSYQYNGKVGQAAFVMKDPLVIDAKGADWTRVEYLGKGYDELSEEIREIANKLKYAYGDEERQLQRRYDEISHDVTNPYGKHRTDWWAKHMFDIGYDGIVIKNINDNMGGSSLGTDIIVKDKAQIKDAQFLTGAEFGAVLQEYDDYGFIKAPKTSKSKQVSHTVTVGSDSEQVKLNLGDKSGQIEIMPKSSIGANIQSALNAAGPFQIEVEGEIGKVNHKKSSNNKHKETLLADDEFFIDEYDIDEDEYDFGIFPENDKDLDSLKPSIEQSIKHEILKALYTTFRNKEDYGWDLDYNLSGDHQFDSLDYFKNAVGVESTATLINAWLQSGPSDFLNNINKHADALYSDYLNSIAYLFSFEDDIAPFFDNVTPQHLSVVDDGLNILKGTSFKGKNFSQALYAIKDLFSTQKVNINRDLIDPLTGEILFQKLSDNSKALSNATGKKITTEYSDNDDDNQNEQLEESVINIKINNLEEISTDVQSAVNKIDPYLFDVKLNNVDDISSQIKDAINSGSPYKIDIGLDDNDAAIDNNKISDKLISLYDQFNDDNAVDASQESLFESYAASLFRDLADFREILNNMGFYDQSDFEAYLGSYDNTFLDFYGKNNAFDFDSFRKIKTSKNLKNMSNAMIRNFYGSNIENLYNKISSDQDYNDILDNLGNEFSNYLNTLGITNNKSDLKALFGQYTLLDIQSNFHSWLKNVSPETGDQEISFNVDEKNVNNIKLSDKIQSEIDQKDYQVTVNVNPSSPIASQIQDMIDSQIYTANVSMKESGNENIPSNGTGFNGEKIINKLTGKEISSEAYDILSRLQNGENVSKEELINLPDIKEGYDKVLEIKRQFQKKYGDIEDTSAIGTEERRKLREHILRVREQSGSFSGLDTDGNEVFNGEVERSKKAVIVTGLPASGKSSALVQGFSELIKGMVIDSDIIKQMLPEFQEGWGAGLVHNESGDLNFKLLERAASQGDNIVLPIVGSKVSSVLQYLDVLKEAGYTDIQLATNEVSNDSASMRNLLRFFSTGRFLEPGFIKEYGDNPSQVFDELLKGGYFNGYYRYNNEVDYGSRPELRYSSGSTELAESYLRNFRAKRTEASKRNSQQIQIEESGKLNDLLIRKKELSDIISAAEGSDINISSVLSELQQVNNDIDQITDQYMTTLD